MIHFLHQLEPLEAFLFVFGFFWLLVGFILLAAWKYPTEGADESQERQEP